MGKGQEDTRQDSIFGCCEVVKLYLRVMRVETACRLLQRCSH